MNILKPTSENPQPAFPFGNRLLHVSVSYLVPPGVSQQHSGGTPPHWAPETTISLMTPYLGLGV